MNAGLPTEMWQAHLDAFRDDLVAILEAGPLEYVTNLDTIVTDALIGAGLPGVFALLDEYRRRLEQAEKDKEHYVGKAHAKPESGSCVRCGETSRDKLMVPDTTCKKCFLDTFQKYEHK